jgi:hypothetical protein
MIFTSIRKSSDERMNDPENFSSAKTLIFIASGSISV